MQTEQADEATSPSWFVIAFDGDMILKVFETLDIGESDAGELVLNPSDGQSLVRLAISDRELCVDVLAKDMTLAETDRHPAQHLSFSETTTVKLNFPHDSLIIAPDFVAGNRAQVDREISFSPIAPPAIALQRLEEPITLVDQRSIDEPAIDSNEEALPDEIIALLTDLDDDSSDWPLGIHSDVPDEVLTATAEIDALLIETADFEPHAAEADSAEIEHIEYPPTDAELIPTLKHTDLPDKTVFHEPFDNIPPIPDALTPLPRPPANTGKRPRRISHHLLVAACAIVAVLIPVYMQDTETLDTAMVLRPASSDPDGQLPVVDGSEALPPDPAPAEPVDLTASSSNPSAVDPIPPPAELAAADPTAGGQTGTEAPDITQIAVEPAAEPAADPLKLTRLLEQAQTLYDAGNIIDPPEYNAVKVVEQVLRLDPTNEAGLRLMYLSATRLLADAETAYANGNYFLARNIVEEVLGFHPTFEEARTLLRTWERETAGPAGSQEG